jgi:hypothetical protein
LILRPALDPGEIPLDFEVDKPVPIYPRSRARADVGPLLERELDMDLVTRETLDSLLASRA